MRTYVRMTSGQTVRQQPPKARLARARGRRMCRSQRGSHRPQVGIEALVLRAAQVLDAARAARAGPAADLARGHQRVVVAPQRDLLVVVDQQLGDLVQQRAPRVVEVVAIELGERLEPLVAFREAGAGGERVVEPRALGLDRAELLGLEARGGRERVAELEEALR